MTERTIEEVGRRRRQQRRDTRNLATSMIIGGMVAKFLEMVNNGQLLKLIKKILEVEHNHTDEVILIKDSNGEMVLKSVKMIECPKAHCTNPGIRDNCPYEEDINNREVECDCCEEHRDGCRYDI